MTESGRRRRLVASSPALGLSVGATAG